VRSSAIVPYSLMGIILAVGLVMTLLGPRLWRYDVSFRSFAAMRCPPEPEPAKP
jgi:hypothetical protein